MSLPTSYMTGGYSKIGTYFDALLTAKAPDKFTIKFFENLGFTSSTDRLFINVLKVIGFLDETGSPTIRYFDFLDQSKSKLCVADGIREAYFDLFQLNVNAQNLTKQEIEGKFKTLTSGQKGQRTITQMTNTFKALCEYADWNEKSQREQLSQQVQTELSSKSQVNKQAETEISTNGGIFDLNYNIHIHLPATRDESVYDALFASLAKHIPFKQVMK